MQIKPLTTKVITIDGPAGAGKSTVAKIVAAEIGWIYITTGAIYRTFALLLHEAGITEAQIDLNNIERFISFINERYRQESNTGKVFLGDREVSQEIKSQFISNLASIFSQKETIRKKLLTLQRRVVLDNNGAVVDGRDMGTVVFPDAPLKIFLTASSHERAKRREKELADLGEIVNFDTLLHDINERDSRDINREIAPLKPSNDAITIDSTSETQFKIAQQIVQLAIQKKMVVS